MRLSLLLLCRGDTRGTQQLAGGWMKGCAVNQFMVLEEMQGKYNGRKTEEHRELLMGQG